MQNIKLVILGRDGILNVYREDHVTDAAEWQPVPGALDAVSRINHGGWHVVVATNQAGIGRGMIDMAAVNAIHALMHKQLMAQGARVDAVFFCPHPPDADCDCRKPRPGMMLDIALRYGVDLRNVPMVGDTLRDLQAAQAAGCEPHLLHSGRAATLSQQELADVLAQVPSARVHADLDAFADFLLQRDHVVTSGPGALS